MRVLKIILLFLITAVVGLGVAGYIFIKTSDIDQYRGRIAQEISARLGREVRIDNLEFGMSADKGVTLNIQGLSVADNPRFSSDPMFACGTVYLNVDILALLLKRQLVVSQVILQRPRLNGIKTSGNQINLQEFHGGGNTAHSSSGTTGGTGSAATAGSAGPSEPFWKGVFIQAVRIDDGTFTFIDRSQNPPETIAITRISFRTTNFALKEPFSFDLAAALWADAPNVHAAGDAVFNPEIKNLRLRNVRLETDLGKMDFTAAPFYVFLRETLGAVEEPQGKILLNVGDAMVSPAGLRITAADGQLTSGRIQLQAVETPLEDIHAELRMDDSNIELAEFSFACALGKITAHGRVSDYSTNPMFLIDGQAEDIQVSRLIPVGAMPVLDARKGPLVLEGRISGDFEGEGSGYSPQSVQASSKGSVTADLSDGRLANMNLLRFVLDKLSFLPNLSSRVEENLPPKYKNRLQTDQTTIEDAKVNMKLHAGGATFDARVQADGFVLNGDGTLDWQQNLVMDTTLTIPSDFSKSMVQSVAELSFLQDEAEQIQIPFKEYRGKLTRLSLVPDVESLGKKVVESKGKEELRKVIFKAVGIDNGEEPQTTPPPEQGGSQPPTQDKQPQGAQKPARPEEILIDSVLDAIFKGGQSF